MLTNQTSLIPRLFMAVGSVVCALLFATCGGDIVSCYTENGVVTIGPFGEFGCPNVPPAKITDLTARLASDITEVNLSWTNPGDKDLESISIRWLVAEESRMVGSHRINNPALGSGEEYTVTNLDPGTRYNFLISAMDRDQNESKTSSIEWIPVPIAITNLTASVDNSALSVNLAWQNAPDIPTDTPLIVAWGVANDDESASVRELRIPGSAPNRPRATSITIDQLVSERAYIFAIQSEFSAPGGAVYRSPIGEEQTVMARPDNTPPSAVANATVAALANSLRITWTNPAASDLAAVVLTWKERGDSSAPVALPPFTFGTVPAIGASAVTEYTLSGLTGATAYTLTLTAVDNDGNQSPAVEVMATPMAVPKFSLHTNGVTILCPTAAIGESGVVNGATYTKRTKGGAHRITEANAATSCTSDMTDMSNLISSFSNKASFNENISHWDTSSVINMNYMFNGATVFNQNISSWNVENVTDMNGMFERANNFNQNIGSWDVSAVTSMNSMFWFAHNFNQNIGGWDVAAVANMNFMFNGATAFNQNLSRWCVSGIPAKPTDFDQNSALASNPNPPQWGDATVASCSS